MNRLLGKYLPGNRLLGWTLAAWAVAFPGSVAAQESPQRGEPEDQEKTAEQPALESLPHFAEEVTVTARKREEDLQSVPFSLVAPTEQALRNRSATSLEDVSVNVAGFSVHMALSPALRPGIFLGGPPTQEAFVFDPELPAYDLLNLRIGLLTGRWDVAFFIDNVTNERARLALDQERGSRARVGYLTNPPRSLGISARIDF